MKHLCLPTLLTVAVLAGVASAQTGTDDCASADPIMGTGSFNYDLTGATDGIQTASCIPHQDVWFVWTAPVNGNFIISTCSGSTDDTKLAVPARS